MSIVISDAERRRMAANRQRLLRLVPKDDCQGERPVDANDIIMADIAMLVAKSDALIGVERTNETLPTRVDLVLTARALSRKG